jgi:TRAP transporter TAXI family solute receptor
MLRQAVIAMLFAVGLTVPGGTALYLYQRPTILTLAVGPPGSDDERLVAAIAQRLAADNAAIRLRVLGSETPASAAAALGKGDADLAIIRSDLGIPGSARAVAIFHRNVVLLVAASSSKIKRVADLAGKTVGVIGHPGINHGILDIILKQHEMAPGKVRVVTIGPSEVRAAVAAKRVDALLAVGPQHGRSITEALSALTVGSQPPRFLRIDNAAGIAKWTSAFEETEIVAGSFGANKPAEAITTMGFQNFLVVRQTLGDGVVAEFTRLLFNLRPTLAIDFPSAVQIEAPETKKDARLPVHSGAAAYLDGEERSFFDVYGDWFYYGLLGFGLLGSAFAWMVRMLAPSRAANEALFEPLLKALARARQASSVDELDELERQADAIFTGAVRRAEAEALDESQLTTFSFALGYLREAVAERRTALAEPHRDAQLPLASVTQLIERR